MPNRALGAIERYCKKTKIVKFSKDLRSGKEKWFYDGKIIEQVSVFKYLGLYCTSKKFELGAPSERGSYESHQDTFGSAKGII